MNLIKERCTGCGYCVLVCPYDALKTGGWAEVIEDKCTNCNLCVYACPTDCFVPEPDFSLKSYTPRIKEKYDVVIIGSGLGGLMAGVALAQAGHSVAVFEKLGFPGGRYTEIDYRGAAVTTGAWTNLGPKSHIGRFLIDMGIDLEYASLEDVGLTEQYAIHFPDGRHYQSLFDLLTPQTRKAWLKAVLTGKQHLTKSPNEKLPITNYQLPITNYQLPITNYQSPKVQSPDTISTADYIAEFSTDPDLLAVVEAITATASGLSSQKMPAGEYIQITLDTREVGREFAMPVGGVRAIIRALTKALRQAGGELFVRSPVAQILVTSTSALPLTPSPWKGEQKASPPLGGIEGGQKSSGSTNLSPLPPLGWGERGQKSSDSEKVATGIKLENGREVHSKIVLHNGGPGAFVKLAGSQNLPQDYLDKLAALKGVECAALFCATREPLFTDAPITITPQCRRVVGVFSPTVLDPGLSKNGLHLADAFFPTYNDNRIAELELALADMRDLFPNFDDVVEWTVPMFFTGSWPGTESGQTFGQTGQDRLDPVTPIENCYLVGMDVKGSGVAGDLIPLGVWRVLDYLKLPVSSQ